MIIVLLDVGKFLVAHFLVGAHPEVAAVGQDVALVDESEHFLAVAPPGIFIGVAQTTVHHGAAIDHDLRGDFQRGALLHRAAHAGINAAGVFAHHDKIHILGFLVLQRAVFGAVEFDRAQVDVLIQRETGFEQDAHFEDAGFDVGMADGAQIQRAMLAEFFQRGIRQRFAGLEIAVTPKIIGCVIKAKAEFGRGRTEHLHGLAGDFGAGPVAGNQSDGISLFHKAGHF